MLILFLFPIIICQENIIKNPSFEEINSTTHELKDWYVVENADISHDCYSGNNCLHWKPLNYVMINFQYLNIEKGYVYDVCIHYKINNIVALQMFVVNEYSAEDYEEVYYSDLFIGTKDWTQACYTIGPIQRSSSNINKFFLGIYTHAQIDETGTAEAFIDDISITRIKDIFEIRLSNDRDEVYDVVNAIIRIHPDKGNNTLKDWDFTIRIKDNDKIILEKKQELESSLFTIPIKVDDLNLKNNNIYRIEGIVKSKIDKTTDIFSYPFKKIDNKNIKRKIRLDEYGRMFINDELFFPFGIYLGTVEEKYLNQVNKTHLNFILPYDQLDEETMDMVYETQQGKIKVIYSVKDMYTFDADTCSDPNEEANYNEFLAKINQFKDHPALLSWYINDETPACFHKNLRNRTLSIHEIDPNHPTTTVLCQTRDVINLINTTDIMGFDEYPVGVYSNGLIRTVDIKMSETFDKVLEGKLFLPVIQIFDWAAYFGDSDSCIPTFEEMRSMSWQGFVAGGKGIIYYSLFDLYKTEHISPFEDRWKDVIKLTDEVWKYKDIILSIDKVNKIETFKNPNVKYKQWKYKSDNYIVVVNLERSDEIFVINLLDEFDINKEFGLGSIIKNGSNITFNLKPIDVIMIKYSKNQNNNNNNFIIIIILPIIIALIIIVIVTFFIVKRYVGKKNETTNNFDNTTSKLVDDKE